MGFMFIAMAIAACAVCWFRSPHGRRQMVARRRAPADDESIRRLQESVDDLAHAVTGLRAEVYDLGERVDFTERALTAMRRREAIPQSTGLD